MRYYVRFVERFAKHFGKSPDKLGPEHIRSYQSYLLKQRKLSPESVEHHISALRFFYVQTLHRQEFRQFLPYPRVRRKLPRIPEPGARLKITDVGSQRMILHVLNRKGRQGS